MEKLIEALREYLVAEGEESGRKVYHFLLRGGEILEIVV